MFLLVFACHVFIIIWKCFCLQVNGQDLAGALEKLKAGDVDSASQVRPDPDSPRELISDEDDVAGPRWRAHRKHVFILSEAGKPIYSRCKNLTY